MKCRVCGYTSNEDFDRVTVNRPDGCGTIERLPTELYVCPNCGTAKVKTEKEKTECPWCNRVEQICDGTDKDDELKAALKEYLFGDDA